MDCIYKVLFKSFNHSKRFYNTSQCSHTNKVPTCSSQTHTHSFTPNLIPRLQWYKQRKESPLPDSVHEVNFQVFITTSAFVKHFTPLHGGPKQTLQLNGVTEAKYLKKKKKFVFNMCLSNDWHHCSNKNISKRSIFGFMFAWLIGISVCVSGDDHHFNTGIIWVYWIQVVKRQYVYNWIIKTGLHKKRWS